MLRCLIVNLASTAEFPSLTTHHLTKQLEKQTRRSTCRVEEALYVSLASPSDGIDSTSKPQPLFPSLPARD
jgi:hypothetical protein